MIFRRRRYAKVNPNRVRREQAQEKPAPKTKRKYPPARIELEPAHALVDLLNGGKSTVAKVYRPGDSGPFFQWVHITIAPDEWDRVSKWQLRSLARKMQVEESDLRKAVEALCSER